MNVYRALLKTQKHSEILQGDRSSDDVSPYPDILFGLWGDQ